jgi:hypothetical protein
MVNAARFLPLACGLILCGVILAYAQRQENPNSCTHSRSHALSRRSYRDRHVSFISACVLAGWYFYSAISPYFGITSSPLCAIVLDANSFRNCHRSIAQGIRSYISNIDIERSLGWWCVWYLIAQGVRRPHVRIYSRAQPVFGTCFVLHGIEFLHNLLRKHFSRLSLLPRAVGIQILLCARPHSC